LIHDLVQGGIDQCQSAMKRLSSRKLFNRYKATLPKHLQDRNIETRAFRLDSLSEAVEELIARLRSIDKTLWKAGDDEEDVGDDEDSDDSDGWVDPDDSESPQKSSFRESSSNIDVSPPGNLSPLDPHVHARFKRPRTSFSNRATRRVSTGQTLRKRSRVGMDGSRHKEGRRNRRSSIPKMAKRKRVKVSEDNLSPLPVDSENDDDSVSPLPVDSENNDVLGPVPDLDELLGLGERGRSTKTRSALSLPRTKQRTTEDIATRMDRFLLANRELDVSSPVNKRGKRPRRERRLSRAQRKSGSTEREKPQSLVPATNKEKDTLNEDLIAELQSGASVATGDEPVASGDDENHAGAIDRSSRTIEEVCEALSGSFPNSSCLSLLKEALRKGKSEHAPVLFVTLVRMLQAQGCMTLQELVAKESQTLRVHISLYVTLLSLLKKGLNKLLAPHHGAAYDLFKADRCSFFMEFLVWQLVDAVYSLVHPVAWSLQIRDRRRICRFLEPLRDALAEHLPLTERVCRCIERELGNQVWRRIDERRIVFVSAIDPAAWRCYLTSSQVPKRPSSVRFASLGKVLPSCETEAVWSLIAFFASTTSPQMECNEITRWTFVAQLLTRSVLLTSSTPDALPPCSDQLRSACTQIRNLAHLILSGSMGTLPRQDTVVIDVVKRSIALQAEDILRNVQSREAAYPSVEDARNEMKQALLVWRDIGKSEPREEDQTSIPEIAKQVLTSHTTGIWMGQPLLNPSSELTQCCLGLVLAWTDQIPVDKPTRWRRYDMAISALVKSLLDECQPAASFDQAALSQEKDLFQQAFSDDVVPPKPGLPESRKRLFIQESAVYLKVYSFLKNGSRAKVMQICHEVWEILSDEAMRSRFATRDAAVVSSASFVYDGDALRPYTAAKACALLSLLTLGVSPTSLLPKSIPGFEENDGTTLGYLISCLIVCLDCSSSSGNPETASSVARLMVLVLENLRRCFMDGGFEAACWAGLCKNLMRNVISSFQLAFRMFTSKAFCGVEEDMCLVSMFSLLRAVFLLDSLPLNDQSGTETSQRENGTMLQALYQSLTKALREAKPSNRYEINQPSSLSNDDERMSHQGKILLDRRYKVVCSILSTLVTHKEMPDCPSNGAILRIIPDSNHSEDVVYERKIRRVVSGTLCKLSASSSKASLTVRGNYLDILHAFVESLLDVDILQKLPSCNIERMKSRSGGAAEHKALADYENFSRRNNTSREKAEGAWSFGTDLGSALMNATDGESEWLSSLGGLFLEHDGDLTAQVSIKLVPSLERECMDRARCLRGLLSFSRSCPEAEIRFEELSAFLIAYSANQLLKLVGVLIIEDKARQGAGDPSYKQAKLFETFSCYVEVHFCLLAWIFREGTHVMTESFASLWTSVCDLFISPILRGDSTTIAVCLSRTRDAANALCSGRKISERTSADMNSQEPEEYRKLVLDCLVRRCREVILPLAVASFSKTSLKQPSGLLQAILHVGAKGTPYRTKLICRSFFARAHNASFPNNDDAESPLRFELDKYLATLDECYPLTPEICSALSSLKQHAIKTLVNTIKNERAEKEQKVGALKVLDDFFRMEHFEEASETPRIEIHTLCTVVRGISSTLRCELASAVVNNDLVALVFACTSSFAALPAACVDRQSVGWLHDWCVTEAENEGMDAEVGAPSLCASYLSAFFSWLKTVADAFLDKNKAAISRIQEYRKAMRLMKEKGESSWPTLGDVTSRMQDLEQAVFRNTHRNVINNYAVARAPNDETVQSWHPNTRVLNAAKEFVTKVKRT
jgi:hypothetical protein